MDIARLDLPDLHARMLERVVVAVRDDERFEALPGTGSLASPVKGMPGLLLDFIDGKQSRA